MPFGLFNIKPDPLELLFLLDRMETPTSGIYDSSQNYAKCRGRLFDLAFNAKI